MEVRIGAELGLKMVDRDIVKKFKPNENPANIPGEDLGNSQYRQTQKESNALRPGETKNVYSIQGGSINIQA